MGQPQRIISLDGLDLAPTWRNFVLTDFRSR
jgi:hypothetical protein